MLFDISKRGIKSLKHVKFPEGVTYLNCSNNQLTSLEGCPRSVTVLDCRSNRLTSLEGCPAAVKMLWYFGNPIYVYVGCNWKYYLEQQSETKAILKIRNIWLNKCFSHLQRRWRYYWMNPEGKGFNRYMDYCWDKIQN